jgi:glutamine synthetase
LSIPQAIKIVEDYFFHTSNKLYNLGLPLKLLSSSPKAFAFRTAPTTSSDLEVLIDFLKRHPSTKFLRLQYLDFTALLKMRVIPVKRALTMLQNQHGLSIGITKASMALLQNDTIIAEGSATGEYRLHAAFSSLKAGPTDNFATVQGDFREGDGSPSALCSRSALQRALLEAKLHGLEFMTGFEIEVVFLIRSSHKDEQRFATIPESRGHAWSSARVMRNDKILKMTEEIYDTLANTGIYLEQWHPESSSGQYEFVLPPLPPLAAVDTLLHAREIIGTVASRYSMHATLHPKPFPMMAGTASHVHISISSPNGEQTAIYESFYAGILAHLRAICAFTYSTAASYDRVADGCWAGGRWVTWGSQNRETPLRKVAGSHWEIKCLDGLANVYLAMAAIISAGVEGVVSQETLVWKDCEKDPASLTADERAKLGIEEPLPASLEEALEELEEDDGLGEMLGKELMARYVAVKKAEANFLNGMETEERREWIIERY